MSELSAGDILAMKDSNGVNSWVWIILIFLFLGWNKNGNGNEFIQRDIFDTQSTVLTSATDNLKATLQSGYDNTINTLKMGYDNSMATMQGRYDTLLGFKDAQYQQSQCCCEIKSQMAEQTNALATAIHSEGEATRALIQTNRIADLEYQLNQANTAVANAIQTQNILSNLGKFVPTTAS